MTLAVHEARSLDIRRPPTSIKCALHLPQATASYTHHSVRCIEAILGDREIAEVFFLATEGLHRDFNLSVNIQTNYPCDLAATAQTIVMRSHATATKLSCSCRCRFEEARHRNHGPSDAAKRRLPSSGRN